MSRIRHTIATPYEPGSVNRHRLSSPPILLAAIVAGALASLVLVPSAFAAKTVDRFIGGQVGGSGGQFNGAADVAVNATGIGGAAPGDTYVVDGNNHRIQVFEASGMFKFAFGRDVIVDGAPGDEGEGFEQCVAAQHCKAGLSGNLGGEFSQPSGVAVDPATGDLFVKDTGTPTGTDAPNSRIQQFSAAGQFIRAWGVDVIQPGGTGDSVVLANERQTVTLAGTAFFPVTGGTFTLSFGGAATGPIVWNASAAALQGALEGLSSIGVGNVIVTGTASPWTVEFTGALADQDVDQMTADSSKLTTSLPSLPGTAQIATVVRGGPQDVLEACTVASECKSGVSGSGAGQLNAFVSNGIYVAPEGAPNAGHVYVADTGNNNQVGNRRLLEFDPNQPAANMFIRTIGNSSQFASGMPRDVAVDSAGVIYAADTSDNGHILRFDASGASISSIPAPPLHPGGTGTSTQGLEVDPDSDGAGPDEDVLYVLRDPSVGNTVIQQFDQPGLPSPPLVAADTHMPTELSTFSGNGLGIDSVSGDLYVSRASGFFALDDDGAGGLNISAQIESATNVTATGATLSGSVNPDNGFAAYQFEYTADGTDWITLPRLPVIGSGAQPVSYDLSGLAPNALHRVRLVAVKVLGVNDSHTILTTEILLWTAAAKPTVHTRSVGAFDDTSAMLVGEVNPNNDSTTYRFEWGKTASYGNEVPFPESNAGAGGRTKTVLQRLGGLEPGTPYHYRIAASNDLGTSYGANMTFTTRPHFEGFPERAYEQVTPVAKIEDLAATPTAVADTGDGIPFTASYILGAPIGSASAGHRWPFVARRVGGRWETKVATPRRSDQGTDAGIAALAGPSLLTGLVGSFVPWEGEEEGGFALRDYENETQVFVAPPGQPEGSLGTGGFDVGSSDLNRIVFHSPHALGNVPGLPDHVMKLYEWVDGEIRLVSREPSGAPFGTNSFSGSNSLITGQFSGGVSVVSQSSGSAHLNSLSVDGRHIYFTTPAVAGTQSPPAGARIYRRSDGQTTTLVSPTRRTPPDPLGTRAKTFQLASADGDKVFFTSSEQLTNDANTGSSRAGAELYRYEVSTDSLIAVSAETNTGNGARVRGVLGASDDGEWIYYVGLGQVVEGAGTPGRPNLYLWHDDGSVDGETRFVTTLAEMQFPVGMVPSFADQCGDSDLCNISLRPELDTSRVGSDGQTAIFQSERSLTGHPTDGHVQIYVYEADADGGKGALSCVSCRPEGARSAAASRVVRSTGPQVNGRVQSAPLSTDGDTVFFHTAEALVETDRNDVGDVYAWKAGRLGLITPGRASKDTQFVGASPDGRSVFFNTSESLVGQDYDTMRDIYVARVGGGLAYQNAPPPGEPCQGDDCKPPATPTPTPTPTPASGVFRTEGNYTAPFSVARLSPKQLRSLSVQGRVSVRVRLDQAGRLTIRALRGQRVVGSASRLILRPTTTNVGLHLNRGARRTLNVQGRLSLRLQMRFAGEEQTVDVTLRRVSRNRGRSK